jgi:hypothetical protein
MCKLQCRVVDSIKPALAAAAHNRMRRAHAAAAMRQPFGTIEPQIELMFELQSERIQRTPLHLKRLQLRQRMQGGASGAGVSAAKRFWMTPSKEGGSTECCSQLLSSVIQ